MKKIKQVVSILLMCCFVTGMMPTAVFAENQTTEEINSNSIIADTISDETVLRAKLLIANHSFDFYRNWDSPVQVVAEQLDPVYAATWYTVENLIGMYYKAVKNGSENNIGEVTSVEFYEYLLLKLLDGEKIDYFSITNPFELIESSTNEILDAGFLKKLISAGFKSGTKITNKNMSKIKEICESICGTDSVTDIGWMDAILIPGKSIDDFALEFVKLYLLTTVSNARAEAIQFIGENTQVSALRTAAENVCNSIRQAKNEGINYCIHGGLENSLDGLSTWVFEKTLDVVCEINPSSKILKSVFDTTTFAMDTIFVTDDIATDTIYILGMANIEHALLEAINQAEKLFLDNESYENAYKLVALADVLKQELLEGCDLIISQVNHCERGNLNWNGILDWLSMSLEYKHDFGAMMKWIFGDENSTYADFRERIENIKKSIEGTNFYMGSVGVLDLLRNVETTVPSAWAVNEVNKAISYGILPSWMQNNYQNNITRIELCALLGYMIEVKTGKTASQLADELAQRGFSHLPLEFHYSPVFDDSLYMEINDIKRLGIINEINNGQFEPLGEITRQEVAYMLYRTADVLGYDVTSNVVNYSNVTDWVAESVNFVIMKGIMDGTGNDFNPEGKLTKEQAISALVRFFEFDDNIKDVAEFEPVGINIFETLPAEFVFTSGAGAWKTVLTINDDGTFIGQYLDTDIGVDYICDFNGKFTAPKKISEYIYSMNIEMLNVEKTPGTEYYENGFRCVAAEPYGLDNADEFQIYLPGAPIAELPEGFLFWAERYGGCNASSLGFYGLYNVGGKEGFAGDDFN